MMRFTYFAFFLMACTLIANAQDEGTIVKHERIERSSNIFLAFGPSVTLGKNIGDYSVGFNIEGGFVKRLNRVFSIGPSISYVQFKYDPEVTNEGYKNAFIGGPFDDNGFEYYEGLAFTMEGGDISLLSLALNLKLNLIPVKDDSKISIYGFAKPFVSYSTRTEVTGRGQYSITYDDINSTNVFWEPQDTFNWVAGDPYVKSEYGIDVTQDMKEETKVTGGIFIGPGIEIAPAKSLSGFFQIAIGYTFPITYVSTEAYNQEGSQNDLDVLISSGEIENYPMKEAGFPSMSFQLGISYNF